ncbi:CBS domain-containing protein [Sulfolobales archaeon HS-7]|nr:CBS domain-containing protein [Sulfolobales archaeon HS-7]
MDLTDKFIPLIAPEMDIGYAVSLMVKQKAEHAIISQNGRAVGVLSIKDLASRLFLPAEEGIELLEIGNLRNLLKKKCSEIMTRNIVKASSIDEAVKVLREGKFGVVPMEHNNRISVVSERSILQALFNRGDKVVEVSKPIISLEENSIIEEILEMMIAKNIRRIPLRSNSSIVSVVTLFNVIKWIFSKLAEEGYDTTTLFEPASVVAVPIKQYPNISVGEAAKELYESPEVGAIIIDDGIITERDMIKYLNY